MNNSSNPGKLKKAKIIGFSFGFPAIVAAIIFLFDKIYYFAADDYLLNLISQGAFGKVPDPYLIYNHVLLGYLLKLFYTAVSGLNWYAVFQIITVVFMFGFMNYQLIKRVKQPYVVLAVNGILELVILYHLTFTITSYLCIGAAYLYLYSKLQGKEEVSYRHCNIWRVASIFGILVVCGACWRSGTFLTATFIFLPLIFGLVRKNKATFIAVCAGVVLTAGLNICDDYFYRSDSASVWAEHEEYKNVRTELLDFHAIDYESNQEAFKAIGLSKNDVSCFYRWIMADKEVYSLENLERMSQIHALNEKYNFNVLSIIKHMFELKYNYWFLAIVLISFILVRKCRWLNLSAALCTYAMIAALFFRNRPVLRVMVPLYILGMIVLIIIICYHGEKEPFRNKKANNLFALAAFAVAFVILLRANNQVQAQYEQQENNYKEVYEYIQKNDSVLFVGSSTVVNPLEYSWPIFETGKISSANVVKLGSWDIYSPRYYAQMEDYGIRNKDRLLPAMAEENSKIYYLVNASSGEMELILEYMREHVADNIMYEEIKYFKDSDTKVIQFFNPGKE